MRMAMRRFTRLSNAFAKELANHEAAVALHFMHYNSVHPPAAPGYPCDGRWRDG